MFCLPWRKSNQIASAPPDVEALQRMPGAPLVNFLDEELANAQEIQAIRRCLEEGMQQVRLARERALDLGMVRYRQLGWEEAVPDRSPDAIKRRKTALIANRLYAVTSALMDYEVDLSRQEVIHAAGVAGLIHRMVLEKLQVVRACEL